MLMPAFARFTTEAEIIYTWLTASHYWTSQNRKSGVFRIQTLTSFPSLQKDRYNTMRKTTSAKVCENVANLAQLSQQARA
jgi:hypothetical protein